jgi:hypothetical protein
MTISVLGAVPLISVVRDKRIPEGTAMSAGYSGRAEMALFWEVCKSFDVDWKEEIPPKPEFYVHRAGSTPWHWTPLPLAGPPSTHQDRRY